MTTIHLDRRPIARSESVVIIIISSMHLYMAGLLLWGPHAGRGTALHAVVDVFRVMNHPHAVAVTMAASAALSVVGTVCHLGWARLVVFFIPQNIFAAAMAAGGLVATWNGAYLDGTSTYPDGTPIGWAHISGDQIGFSAIFLIHAFVTWRRCQGP